MALLSWLVRVPQEMAAPAMCLLSLVSKFCYKKYFPCEFIMCMHWEARHGLHMACSSACCVVLQHTCVFLAESSLGSTGGVMMAEEMN